MRFEVHEKNIKNDIACGITRCMNSAFISGNSYPQEPDFVAELVSGIPQDIYNSLRVYAPQYQIAVSGVFCHQKPLADFGLGRKPELGDMLLVYIEDNKYSKKCNALLMQAKKIAKSPYIICNSEAHQLKLYEEWPTFKLDRAGIYNGTEINIQPKTINSGAQYLLLQSPYNDEKKVCCAYPDIKLVPEKKLSDQIVDLMKFFTGRTFLLDTSCKDDWSKLVQDLISISKISSYNRTSVGRVNASRQTSFGDTSLFNEIYENIEMNNNSIDNTAVSCLLIYARERQ
ncbi:MAG: hypothetical protein Q4E51_06605 [Lachnospiraceae bacterium]|nr:hypothetical protein [Lachnospiraceae bacterium]